MLLREELIRKTNPTMSEIDIHSPLTVGNGNFAFTADVTGLQTLYDEYAKACPVLTMSSWGLHSCLNPKGEKYTLKDLEMTEYDYNGRKVYYPTKETENNKEVYKWLRENPHRINLARIRLMYKGMTISASDISDINQTLDMYTGILLSSFKLHNEKVLVTTAVGNTDTLAVKVESSLLKNDLTVQVDFPYGSPDITGSDFEAKEKHTTRLVNKTMLKIGERKLDGDEYYCRIESTDEVSETDIHEVTIKSKDCSKIVFTMSFAPYKDAVEHAAYKDILEESKLRFYTFWNKGAFIDVTESEDKRAMELQRRIITSMYLSFVQDLGDYPPQETGLTCNSWYGKFHLEMHPIHLAYAALYGKGNLLEKSLEWYIKVLPKAKENAARNGFKGARWPKMTDPEAVDSPSVIAPLLIWQQPHILYMLKLLYLSRYRDDRVEVPTETEEEFLLKYRDVVYETAVFMADFAVYNPEKDIYELLPPLYSVQEKGDPEKIKNPPFETAYFAFGLRTAAWWLEKLGVNCENWLTIADKLAKPYIHNGMLQAYEGCDDTYEKLNMDHPYMLFSFGWLPEKGDEKVILDSLEAVKKNWDFLSLWGWDFALLAMAYASLGKMEEAFDMLLYDSEKNTYVKNGNNAQASRKDLPLYLPGNGSLLLAMTKLKSCKGWYIRTEGLMQYPF